MSTQHTPGSWTFSRTTTYWKICHPSLSTLKGPKVLAMVHHRNPNAEHNARLIAAAPDLLQELINIASAKPSTWEDPTEFKAWAQSRAQAAIAKATGEK